MKGVLSGLILASSMVGAATFQRSFEIGSPIGIEEIPDGYVLAAASGETLSLIGLDFEGDQTWEASCSFSGGTPEAMTLLSDGGILVAGSREYAGARMACIVLTDSTGLILQETLIPFPDSGYAMACTESPSGKLAVCGTAFGPQWPEGEGFIATLTPDGELLGTSVYNIDEGHSELVSIAAHANSGFAACGMSSNVLSWAMRVDENRSTIWTRSWLEGQHWSYLTCCIPLDDFGMVLAGCADKAYWMYHGFADRLDATGSTSWHSEYLTEPTGTLYAYSVDEIDTGGYCVTGMEFGDAILIRTDETGGQIWRSSYMCGFAGRQVRYCIDGGFLIASDVFSGDSTWVIRTDGSGYAGPTGIPGEEPGEPEVELAITACPNPSSGAFSVLFSPGWADVTVRVFDPSGRVVEQRFVPGELAAGQTLWIHTLADLPAGIYIVNARTEDDSACSRLVLMPR